MSRNKERKQRKIEKGFERLVLAMARDNYKPSAYFRTELSIILGRWGGCGSCPRWANGIPRPDLCEHTNRYDHHIDPFAA